MIRNKKLFSKLLFAIHSIQKKLENYETYHCWFEIQYNSQMHNNSQERTERATRAVQQEHDTNLSNTMSNNVSVLPLRVIYVRMIHIVDVACHLRSTQ